MVHENKYKLYKLKKITKRRDHDINKYKKNRLVLSSKFDW